MYADHLKKRNCAKNPWCLYGMGELKEGIWKKTTSSSVVDTIGSDPSVHSRDEDMYCSKQAGLFPPAGLKNFGATCYLNALIQVRIDTSLEDHVISCFNE